jgi:hypothetical protein
VVRALRKLELDDAEKAILEEIIRLHQAESPFWGQ